MPNPNCPGARFGSAHAVFPNVGSGLLPRDKAGRLNGLGSIGRRLEDCSAAFSPKCSPPVSCCPNCFGKPTANMSSADKGGSVGSSLFFRDCCSAGGAGAFLGDRNVGVVGVFGMSTALLTDALILDAWKRLRGCPPCEVAWAAADMGYRPGSPVGERFFLGDEGATGAGLLCEAFSWSANDRLKGESAVDDSGGLIGSIVGSGFCCAVDLDR